MTLAADPDAPIGVFDSGVGGLSVLQAIRTTLPHENLVYVADSGHAPYGDRPEAFIEQRAMAVTGFLVASGAKAVVLACHTVTVVAVEALRARYGLPIVAIEPAIKPAAAASRRGVVGVLATTRTLASAAVARLTAQHAQGVQLIVQACPGLVEAVEAGDTGSDALLQLLTQYTSGMRAAGADTVVLGCTHYPFLRDALHRVLGPTVALVDPAQAVAREVARRLGSQRDPARGVGRCRFHASGDRLAVQQVMTALWGEPLTVHALA